MPKESSIVSHNGSNCNYDFNIKELVKELEGQCTCLGENKEKSIIFSVSTKIVTKIDKKGKIPQKPYLTDYNLLIAKDLWQTHHQVLLIILLK